jgi:hypothetical protein
MLFPMAVRCKVTFFDVTQEMRRSVEVVADSPKSAAKAAFSRMLERHLLPEDFAPSVSVDVLVTIPHSFSLAELVKGETLIPQKAEAA